MIPDAVHPIFASPLLVTVTLAVIVALAVAALRRERRLGRGRRLMLGVLRGVAIVVLGLALIQPSCTNREIVRQRATLLVGLDASRSMTLPNLPGGPTRWQAQLDALAAAEPELRKIAGDAEVLIFTYDKALHPVGSIGPTAGLADVLTGGSFSAVTGGGSPVAGELDLPAQPEGSRTDLAGPLTEMIRGHRGRRVVGIVWMGDGVQTERRPDVTLDQARSTLARLGQPLLAVRFGTSTSREDERDLAVESVPPELLCFVGNELIVNATVSVRGYAEKELPTELIVTNQSTGKQETYPGPAVVVPARDSNALRTVRMTYRATEAGQFTVTVRLPPQPGEATDANNELSSFLTVRDGSLRVLYIEGSLRVEQKFLRRSLDASDDIDVDFLYLSPKDRERWPIDLSTALAKDYDVYLLGDIDSSALSAALGGSSSLDKIRAAVEKGKGLLAMGGYHALDAGGYGATPLADVLPITFDRFARQPFSDQIATDLHRPGPIRLVPTGENFITEISPDGEGSVWPLLPELEGANRIKGLTNRAVVLLEDAAAARAAPRTDAAGRERQAAEAAILVTGPFGSGRVAVMAVDSTWRWWMQGFDQEHRRFWRQLILWLAKREGDDDGSLWVSLNTRRLLPGEDLVLGAALRDPFGDRIGDAKVETTILPATTTPSNAPIAPVPNSSVAPSLPASSGLVAAETHDRKDRLEATYQPETPGRYVVTVTATRPGKSEKRYQTEIVVLDQDPELTTLGSPTDILGQLAALTRASGGRLVAPEELPASLAELATKPLAKDESRESVWKLGDTPGDAWVLFLIMLGALAGEWILRRRWSLP